MKMLKGHFPQFIYSLEIHLKYDAWNKAEPAAVLKGRAE
jgi:hypothetical protein